MCHFVRGTESNQDTLIVNAMHYDSHPMKYYERKCFWRETFVASLGVVQYISEQQKEKCMDKYPMCVKC